MFSVRHPRIAIMAEGELRCMGSSLFLKGLYGVGYTLTVMRKDQSGDFAPRGRPSRLDGEDGPSRRGSLMVRPPGCGAEHDKQSWCRRRSNLLRIALLIEAVPYRVTVSPNRDTTAMVIE